MKTNDRVICIDASNHNPNLRRPSLVKGRQYIVYDIMKCSCGSISFDVGITTPFKFTSCECGNKYFNGHISMCNSKRFAKVQEEYRVVKMEIEIEEPILN